MLKYYNGRKIAVKFVLCTSTQLIDNFVLMTTICSIFDLIIDICGDMFSFNKKP